MESLSKILQRYGREKELPAGAILLRQGSLSDGAYYLKQGRLGVYREERETSFHLAEIEPGEFVGELGATTGRSRTATVKAEEESRVIHISDDDFNRVLNEAPGLAAEIVHLLAKRLTASDSARITLGRSYRLALDRAKALRTEKARLEELLRLREELADTIVHDLRNPLGVLSAGLHMLKRSPAEGAEAEYQASVAKMMERTVRRMQRLVDTLLDIARLEEGEKMLSLTPLDLSGLVEEVVAEERPLAESDGVTLETRLPGDLPSVMGDRDVLQRVLFNLLDNAIKFTPRGGRAWIELQPETERVRIGIVDTGPGIPPEERERIFEKFTQVKGYAECRRGSGLGLAFCRMAVEAHGGRIWVEESSDGVGSCFAFTIPRARD
ncbi:MAG: ATP-binding protein [Anaerolineae bacterium]|jgi:signal transduction histidine kinase